MRWLSEGPDLVVEPWLPGFLQESKFGLSSEGGSKIGEAKEWDCKTLGRGNIMCDGWGQGQ